MSAVFNSPPSQQLFSVPYNFILYIIENPASPEGLQNLYQTCNAKNQILFPLQLLCYSNIIASKFHQCSPKKLRIRNCSLSLAEFDLMVAENSVTTFGLSDAEILNATIDQILEKLPNVNVFYYNNVSEIYSTETFQNLSLIQRKLKFYSFWIRITQISELNFQFLFKFIAQNGDNNSRSEFRFAFCWRLRNVQKEMTDAVRKWNGEKEMSLYIGRANSTSNDLYIKFSKKYYD